MGYRTAAPRARTMCTRTLSVFLAASALTAVLTGCGTADSRATAPRSSSTTILSVPTSTTIGPTTTSIVAEGQAGETFARLAAEVRPMTVFAPTVLPEGATLAATWFPVLESPTPADYDGPVRDNPYVLGSATDPEIQVIYTVGNGWLAIVENFHGDVGDMAGADAGTVDGNRAALFAIDGGELVEWGVEGRWYGVFGRGLSRETILATARGMHVQPAPTAAE